MRSKRKRNGNKKHGRNKIKCAAYRASRERPHKLAKLKRHLNNHLNDFCAIFALEKVKGT